LAIPLTAWAFYSGRGRICGYVAYVVVLLVATLLFAAATAISAHSDRVDPVSFVFTVQFTGIFVIAVVLGVFGFATRRRRPPGACAAPEQKGEAGGPSGAEGVTAMCERSRL
jgi:hypothetical protein